MPSQLKSREELPWLYYPRSNSVRVINSHLGGGASFTPGWQTSAGIASVGDTIISTEGTLLDAKNLGSATNRTVNGVLFTGATTAGTFTSGGGAAVDNSAYTGGNVGSDFEALLDSFIFSATGDLTRNVPISGLTIGVNYMLQIFATDDRSAAIQDRLQSYTIAGHTLTDQRLGDSLSMICYFTATDTTMNLGIFQTGQTYPRMIAGYQVRTL